MMIRRIKQTCLGVLLIVAALLTGCAKDAAVEQQRWHVNIKVDRQGDDALTRSLYLDGTALKARWTGLEVLKVYNSSNVEVGTLTASANLTGGSTTLTGDLTADVSIGDKLYIWSPSNTPDYTVQDGTVDGANGISAKDYIKAEIEVEAKDDANHILNTTDATFDHQQSFTKFSVTPDVHSLKISATGMSDITATLSGTTEGNNFYVALPNTGGSEKSFTLTGTTYAGVAFTDSKSKQLEDGKYYVAAMDLKGEGAATLSPSSVSYGSTTGNKTVTVSGNTGTVSASVTSGSGCSVSVSGTTITITRSTNNAFSATITVTIAASTNYNSTTKAISVSGTAVDPGVAFDNVTSSHKGYYIAKNGKAYSTMDLANQYSTAVGYICYAGSVDKYFSKFIAIALNDALTTSTLYSDAQSKVDTYASNNAVTVGSITYNTNSGSSGSSCYDVVTNSTSTASNTRTGSAAKGWRIPTVTDWRYIFHGLGNGTPSATSPVGVGAGSSYTYGDGSTLRSAINTACGNTALQSNRYWSSSEGSSGSDSSWRYHFLNSYFYNGNKMVDCFVRAVFAY